MKIFTLLFFVILISENNAKVDNAELYDDFIYETEVRAKGACERRDFPLNYYDRREKLDQILEEFNTFMAQKALTGDSSYEFPGEDLLRMINFEALADKKAGIKMVDEKNKINYYWTSLNQNTVRNIVPGTLTRFDCDPGKIFDWETKVDPEFTSDINEIYKKFAMTVAELLQEYQKEMELCQKIPSIKTALIDFVTQAMKSHFQRYIIDVFDARVSTFCRRQCITTEVRAINRRFIQNLNGLDELIVLMTADWHEFQEKCELKSTTTSTTTPAPIIIRPYHRSRPHLSDDYDCWGIFDLFKHHNYFD
ncbi:uncharacterized protein LOC123263002 [Cotesia glomerata]|uniref:Venom protein n=1 Tax=Cotesia glomerata TaxID=32391 RepID=A0AAV7INK5_COTGL|nr:uncharacterized protein LOC123263002 [Cotesia glomerata]KAH0554727.1 hypothetical protein KQX54_012459 [Cotesia glomerata]